MCRRFGLTFTFETTGRGRKQQFRWLFGYQMLASAQWLPALKGWVALDGDGAHLTAPDATAKRIYDSVAFKVAWEHARAALAASRRSNVVPFSVWHRPPGFESWRGRGIDAWFDGIQPKPGRSADG